MLRQEGLSRAVDPSPENQFTTKGYPTHVCVYESADISDKTTQVNLYLSYGRTGSGWLRWRTGASPSWTGGGWWRVMPNQWQTRAGKDRGPDEMGSQLIGKARR